MKSLTIAIIFLFNISVFAQGSEKTYEQLLAEETNLKNQIKRLKNNVEKMEKDIQDSKDEMKAESHFDDASVTAMRRLNLSKMNSNKKRSENELEQLQKKLETLNNQVDIKRTQVLANEAASGVERLTELIQLNAVDVNISQLMQETNNIDLTLDKIESEMEKNAIGMYVQDKIGQLLNSQVICAARKRCLTRGKDEIKASTIQKELFPNSIKTRTEYYDKVKSRSTQGTR